LISLKLWISKRDSNATLRETPWDNFIDDDVVSFGNALFIVGIPFRFTCFYEEKKSKR
jgi:hypothetical protein